MSSDFIHRSYAIELPPDPAWPNVPRFARNNFRIERWRSIAESCGNNGLPPGKTIVKSEVRPRNDNAAPVVRHHGENFAEMNGTWKLTAMETTKDGGVVVYAKCYGPACCESKTPSTKRLHMHDWTRHMTTCLECVNYTKEVERQDQLKRDAEIRVLEDRDPPNDRKRAHVRRGQLKAEGKCIQCTEPNQDTSYARCFKCRAKNMESWRRYKSACRARFREAV